MDSYMQYSLIAISEIGKVFSWLALIFPVLLVIVAVDAFISWYKSGHFRDKLCASLFDVSISCLFATFAGLIIYHNPHLLGTSEFAKNALFSAFSISIAVLFIVFMFVSLHKMVSDSEKEIRKLHGKIDDLTKKIDDLGKLAEDKKEKTQGEDPEP